MNTPRRTLLSFLFLTALLFLLFLWNIQAGTVSLSVGEIGRILLNRQGDDAASRIIWDIRLPRLLAALILGGALSVSGFLLQTFFSNPIAGPYVLGISSGAKLTVSLVLIFLLGRGISAGSAILILAAFAGSMIATGFLLLISLRVRRMSSLVICGVMIGYICSAATDFLITFASESDIVNLHNWSMGSFSGTTWENVQTMALVVSVTFFLVLLLAKPMGAYQLGEVYAQNMGVPIRRFRLALILLSSVLSACVTAMAGPISFVGIAVPHLMKGLFRTARPLIILPACFLGGAAFCLFCDLAARTLLSPTELSISSVTALFGAPVVIVLMLNRKNERKLP